jgi:hypothetical protein
LSQKDAISRLAQPQPDAGALGSGNRSIYRDGFSGMSARGTKPRTFPEPPTTSAKLDRPRRG